MFKVGSIRVGCSRLANPATSSTVVAPFLSAVQHGQRFQSTEQAAHRASSASTPSGKAASTRRTVMPPQPPPGSRAAEILELAQSGEYDESEFQSDLQEAAQRVESDDLPGNPYAPRLSYNPTYVTSKTNPKDHTMERVGKLYQFTADEKSLKQIFPNGVAGDIQEQWTLTGNTGMLVRPLGVQLVQHLENWRQATARKLAAAGSAVKDVDVSAPYTPAGPAADSKDPLRTFRALRLLTGARGSGKSQLLNYAVQYARRNGWIVLFVPDSFEVMHLGRALQRSRRRPGMADQNDIAMKILQEVIDANGAQLSNVPQRRQYAKHRYLPSAQDKVVSAQRAALLESEQAQLSRLKAQADAAGTTWDPKSFVSKYADESDTGIDRSGFSLRDMAAYGIAHPAQATDALVDLLEELRLTTEHPVMIAVDGINMLYDKSSYPEEGTGEILPPERLSVPSAFHCVGPDGFRHDKLLKRGLWLATVSFKHTQDMSPMFNSAAVRGRLRLSVPPLTRPEIYSMLANFLDTGAFLMLKGLETVDPFLVEYYRTLCSGNPGDIFKAAIFTPEPASPKPRAKNFRDRE